MVDWKEFPAWLDGANSSDDDWSTIGKAIHTPSSSAWSDVQPPQPDTVDPDVMDAVDVAVPDAVVDWELPFGDADSASVEDRWAGWSHPPEKNSNDHTTPTYDHYRKLRLHPAELRRRQKSGCCTYCGDKGHGRMTCAAGRLMRKVPKAELNRRLREHICPLCGDPGKDGHLKLTCPMRERLQEFLSNDVYEVAGEKSWGSQGPKRNGRRRGKRPPHHRAHPVDDERLSVASETVGDREDEVNDWTNDSGQDLLDVNGPMLRESATTSETTASSAAGTQQVTGHLMDADNDIVVCGYLPTLPIAWASQTTGVAKPKQKTVTTSHTQQKSRSRKNKAKGRVASAT